MTSMGMSVGPFTGRRQAGCTYDEKAVVSRTSRASEFSLAPSFLEIINLQKRGTVPSVLFITVPFGTTQQTERGLGKEVPMTGAPKTSGRIIGIRQRVKKTKDGKASPTQVFILWPDESSQSFDLEDEQAELDFAWGQFPTEWRRPTAKDDPSKIPFSHKQWKEAKVEETRDLPATHVQSSGKKTKKYFILAKVAAETEGLMSGDRVAMSLGGSGDAFAFAMANRGKKINAEVWRIPTFALAEARGSKTAASKEGDAKLLAELLRDKPHLFYKTEQRHADIARLRTLYSSWVHAQKDRIACGNRLLRLARDRVFINPDGLYPQGSLEEAAVATMTSDPGYQALKEKEEDLKTEIELILDRVGIYKSFFVGIEGMGPAIAARLIASIQDIRRFRAEPSVEEKRSSVENLRASYTRSDEAELLGCFERDIPMVADRLKPEFNRFRVLQMVRSWNLAQGKTDEAEHLTAALNEYEVRCGVRRKMCAKRNQRGVAKLKAYCGVHLMKVGFTAEGDIVAVDSDKATETKWVFPTRYVAGELGRPANWRDEARKALYLFAEQTNRRPDSEWGKKRKEFKVAYAGRHADKSKGQVHDASCWRIAGRFIEALFNAWTKHEDDERGKIAKPTPEEDAKTHDKPRRWATYGEWLARQTESKAKASAA